MAGATGNFNHQILPYGILFLTCISTTVFYLPSFKCSRYLVKTMAFSFKVDRVFKFSRLPRQMLNGSKIYCSNQAEIRNFFLINMILKYDYKSVSDNFQSNLKINKERN
jgi:hypothetical protein